MSLIHALVALILSIHPTHIAIHKHKPKPVVPAPTHAPAPVVDSFDALARCESGGNPATNTGNGFYGAFQFDLTTWHSLGNIGLPSQTSYAVQKAAAQKLQRERGWSPWPACSVQLGLR